MKKILLILVFLPCVFASYYIFGSFKELQIENENILLEIEDENTLLIFSTDWCGYCNKLKKDLDKINHKNYKLHIINADKEPELRKKHKITSYPTSIILLNDKEISRKVGYSSLLDYNKWIKNFEKK